MHKNDHVQHLKETFSLLRKYKMKFNLEKCTFGVSSGKFVRFMVSEKGLEASPQKIKAILETKSPSILKEL